MPFGTVPQGTANRVWIGLTQGGLVLIGGLQNWEFGTTSDTTEEKFYNGDASVITVGSPVYSGSGGGKWEDGDSGLAILAGAKDDGTVVYFAVAPGGTNGEGVPGRVSEFRLSGTGVDAAADYTFSIVQSAAKFDVGAGF
ncbi:MAG: hypothetical protein H0V43_08600 [Gemmatimonadales bacterium]|nr:hypothetical protein [Gemmatimonadales bacterium]